MKFLVMDRVGFFVEIRPLDQVQKCLIDCGGYDFVFLLILESTDG